MQIIWKQDGVTITDVVHAEFKEMTLILVGVVEFKRLFFFWRAVALSGGWRVEIHDMGTNRMTSWDGSTYNLPLEIHTAMQRH